MTLEHETPMNTYKTTIHTERNKDSYLEYGNGPIERHVALKTAMKDTMAMAGEDEGPEVVEMPEEDIEPCRVAPDPKLPTEAEVEEHRACGHIPFRSWCPHCVKGRALGERRGGAGEEGGNRVPVIGMDYFFLTREGDALKEDLGFSETEVGEQSLDVALQNGAVVKCLIVRDYMSKAVFAWTVPQKGIDPEGFVVDRVVEAVKWLGYSNVLLKSDNEPAVVKVLKEALSILHIDLDSMKEEHPVPYDSQSNGGTENGIRNIRGVFRSARSCLEDRFKKRFPVNHPVMSWLLSHTANLMTIRYRNTDGVTPWTRIKGRSFGLRMIGYGEQCWFKLPMKGPQARQRGNSAEKWKTGTFLGYEKSSDEYILEHNGSITTSRAVNRIPFEQRWVLEPLENLSQTPYQSVSPNEPRAVLRDRPAEEQIPMRENPTLRTRRLKIDNKLLEEYGFTDGCDQCNQIRRHGTARAGYAHSEPCRQRIMNAMALTPHGQARLDALEERVNRALADYVEDHQHALPENRQPVEGEIMRQPADHSNEPAVESGAGSHLPSDEPARGETPEASDGGADMNESMEMDHGNGDMDVTNIEDEIVALVHSVGGDGRSYRKEYRKDVNRLVAEIYSPPRMTKMAGLMPSLKLVPGFSLDLTEIDEIDGLPWDFRFQVKRERARALVKSQKPMLLVGSPECKKFSSWSHYNRSRRDPAVVKRELVEAKLHMDFVCELYAIQHEAGRYFVHEHPAMATSWALPCVRRILMLPGVMRTRMDQCQYGARDEEGAPVRKPTDFVTNSGYICQNLTKVCQGRHGYCRGNKSSEGMRHRPCEGKVAKKAAIYPQELCRAVLRGLAKQLRADGMTVNGEVGMMKPTVREMVHMMQQEDAYVLITDDGKPPSGKYKDDMSGQVLLDSLVHEAMDKELGYFEDKEVWELRSAGECRQVTGRAPITVKWVLTNKGDDDVPNYRARLVARQIRHAGVESVFAPTPPLEGVRTVISLAASRLPGDHPLCRDAKSEDRVQLSLIDISRAYFNAPTNPDEPTYVSLPKEHPEHGQKVALLKKHMYGTLKAADGWQEYYSCSLIAMGFVQGITSPCIFHHPALGLVCAVHGDDFTTRGSKRNLDLFEQKLREVYELKSGGRLGPGPEDDKEGMILNRVIKWDETGLHYEADPRQCEKVLHELSLEGANPVATPGLRVNASQALNDPALGEDKHTRFRAVTARCNYLAADRPDCQFAAKEVCRFMSAPTEASYDAVKRLGRYLAGRRRLVFDYPFQEVEGLEVYTDTDWAGCPRTRRSTSGGCVMLGSHCLKSWSTTQPSVSLSSGEAEFYGLVKASGIGLGFQSLLADFGYKVKVRVWTDSSAAMGIVGRQGLGKLRHLDTHSLWVQQAARSKRIHVRKIHGERNPADLFTKHLPSREKVNQLTALIGCHFSDGRASLAPMMRRERMEGQGQTLGGAMGESQAEKYEEKFDGEKDEHVDFIMNVIPEAEMGRDDRLPHQHNMEEIEQNYPKMPILDELPSELDFNSGDPSENVLEEAGNKVIEEIITKTATQGRRRGNGAA